MQITADQALAWRTTRQFLTPRTDAAADEIVARLCGVQAQVASAASTTIDSRSRSRPGPTPSPLVKTWAMRGALHLCHPDQVAGILSLIAAARTWTKPSWQRTFGATPAQVEQLAEAVAELLDGTVMTRDELVTALVAQPRFAGMRTELKSGWGTLLKPLAWQGVLCHGPNRGSAVTFTGPAYSIPDPDTAAPAVIAAYLGAYGPAGPEAFDAWLTRGNTRKSVLRGWFDAVRPDLTEVTVDGRAAGYVLTEHADTLASTRPGREVRLLGPFDAYVLGAGTKDPLMLASEHRSLVSRTAGWISPVILLGGRIVGTWETKATTIVPHWFPGEKQPASQALEAEIARTGDGRPDM